MNENNQEKDIFPSAKYIEFKAIQKPSFYGIPYKEGAPEFELFKELDELGWEIEGDFYRSKDILGSQAYFKAQEKFLKASQDFEGYQLDTPPFSVLEINFLLRAYCPELEGEVRVKDNNEEVRVYFNKGTADKILFQIVLILKNPMSCTERMNEIHEAQKKDQDHEIIYHCGQYILETQNSKQVEDLHLVYWVRSIAFEKMSQKLLAEKSHDRLCFYTAFYYCVKSKLDLLDTLRVAESKNEQSPYYKKKIKPLIFSRLKNPELGKPIPVKLEKRKLYFLEVMHAEEIPGIKEKISMFNCLKELYPNDISLESRCSFLSIRESKIAMAYDLVYEKKHEEAVGAFQELLNNLQGENEREQADYYQRLAYLYVKLKQWENALQSSNQAQQIYPTEMSALEIKARVAFGKGSYEEAILICKCIISLTQMKYNPIYTRDEITSYYTHASYGLGKCHVFLNEHEKAIEHFLNASEKFQTTGFDKVKPSVFIRILLSQNRLCEQNIPLKFSGKINARKIFFYAIQATYEFAEKLLLKTFQNLPEGGLKTHFCDELTKHFIEKKDPEKLTLLCQQLTKNRITLLPEVLISLLDTLSMLKCPQFEKNPHKKGLISLCETALTQYPHQADLYKSVTQALFIHTDVNKVILIFRNLIKNHFDIYLAIPKPDSAQLHYELAETLTLVNTEEAFLSYQKAIELGIKNGQGQVKKLTICALNVVSFGLILNKKKEDLLPLVLQKILQLASSSDPFYKNLTDLLLEENKNTTPQDFRFEMMLALSEGFCESTQIQKIMKSFLLFEKMLDMYPDSIEVCVKIFSLYPQLDSSTRLSKEALWHFYKTIGEKILYQPDLVERLVKALINKTIALPPIASSCQLLYEIANSYPKHSLVCCDAARSLLPNLTEPNIDKFHEKFIDCLFKQNHPEKAFHYYLKVKHLLISSELHERFAHYIQDLEKALSPEEEAFIIRQFGNQPENIRSTAKFMLLTQNPKTRLYDLFMSQLANHGEDKQLKAYHELVQLFKDKKQIKERKAILLQIGKICQLNDDPLSKKKLNILDFCVAIITHQKSCTKNTINFILDLLLPDVDITFKMLENLIDMSKMKPALLLFKEALKRSPDYYEKLLSAFPSVKTDQLHEQLVTVFLELNEFHLAFHYYQQHCSESQSKTLPAKFLSRIHALKAPDFSEFCFHNPKYFEWILSLLNSNEKMLTEQVLEKFSDFCFSCLQHKDLENNQEILYPVNLLLSNDLIASNIMKTWMANFPGQQDCHPELSWKILTKIQGFSPEKFDKFCLKHPKLCFNFARQILKNGSENEKILAKEMLLKILSEIDKYSPLYRKIINTLYQRTTLKLEGPVKDFFKLLTEQFGDEKVYLTGSRVLAFINKKVTSSNDWDFVVFCQESEADILLGENGLNFRKSEKMPGLYTKKVDVGSPAEKTMIEVFCIKPIPEKTMEEQLCLNIEDRDFTICALMLNQYGILFDFVGGEEDAKNHTLRSIKPSFQSFTRDPVRLLRATKYRVNEFEWTQELKNGLVQWVSQFQNLEFDVHDHLDAVIVKHFNGLNETQRKAYVDLLVEERLWEKLFLFETRTGLKDRFQLDIPYEPRNKKPTPVMKNSHRFSDQKHFRLFIPGPYIQNNEDKNRSINFRPSNKNDEEDE